MLKELCRELNTLHANFVATLYDNNEVTLKTTILSTDLR